MSNTFRWNPATGQVAGRTLFTLVVRWLWVAVPLTWGILETLRASKAFFR
jgi:hypothetical protein